MILASEKYLQSDSNSSSAELPMQPSRAGHSEKEQMARSHSNSIVRWLLQLVCITLHMGLLLIHVGLLVTGFKHWEHKITFPLELQTTVSLWVTAFATTIGTIYAATLVFLTQKLAMRQDIQSCQSLTTTHDRISSWKGLGSTTATVYK
ncbi:hypothetical protein C8R44DRAFT_778886 [Mycena epipterygia]|nr:hypothetical protein C8R44DRAFT_778886 [Mycena epipterygia]